MKRRSNLSKKRKTSPSSCSRVSEDQTTDTAIRKHDGFEDIEDVLLVPRLNFIYSVVLIVLCSLFCFWSSLYGDFVFDDAEAIVNNRDVTSNNSMFEIFSHDFWGSDITSNLSHKSYRPLTTLTFKLNYYISGGLHPWSFHLVNTVIHTIVCVFFLLVFDIIYGSVDGYYDIAFQLKFPRASLLSVLFFTLHPIHTESVCGIVGRAELLSALLFALAFIFYAVSCKQGTLLEMPVKMFLLLIASMLLAATAMLCKEQGITVLGVCCVYDTVLAVSDFGSKKTSKKKNSVGMQTTPKLYAFKPFICRQIFLGCCGILMILGRFQVMGRTVPKFKPIDNPASFLESSVLRTINYNYIYSLNLWLLIFPSWLCFDWSMGCVPVINTVSDIRILAPIVMWLMICYISWFSCHSTRRSMFLMAVALLVVPFLPASNLFFQVGFVVAERVLYLSSGGYCVLLVLGLAYISKSVHRKIAWILTYGCLAFFMWRSVQRSGEWANEEILFTSGEGVCPLNAKVHYNIGKIKADANNVNEALKYYKEAIRLFPEYDQAYNNLGNLLENIGDLPNAEKTLEKAVAIRPTFAAAWMNLGITKSSLKKYQEAEQCYLNALTYRKKYTDAHFNLGNLYREWKKPEKALEEYQKSIRLDPLKESAWNNFIILLENTDQLEKAALLCKQALNLLPNYAGLHFSLGNILGKLGKFKKSEGHFLKAIQIDSANSNYYGNLGVLYHRWGKKDKAKTFYEKALSLNPGNQMVQENFQKLQRKAKRG